jgi:hypothetical protein
MVLEQELQPYSVWLPQALWSFGETAFFVILAALVISYLVAAFRYGPLSAGDRLYRAIIGAIVDLIHISPRRVWALARLAIQEAFRRRVWTALIAFVVILMFAGWFLDPSSPEPGPLYLKFVMSWTTYLVVLMALFISTFSLPTDIKNRTITTVVTKPVRTAEIVLGRIVGFTAICTTLLVVMGFCSYVFVVRSLAHTHEIRAEDMNEAALNPEHLQPGRIGTTEISQNHQHDVILNADGTLETDFKHGHMHKVTVKEVDGKKQYLVGAHEGMLTARLPIIGQLRFLDRDGQPKEHGINVGKEWDYRGFVDGNTQSAAVWTFDNIDENTMFPNVPPEKRTLPLKWTIRVFRTYKGNIEKGITGKIVLRNPATQVRSAPIIFSVKEFTIDGRNIDRKIMREGAAESDPPLDLFKDLVHNGQLEVWLQCLEPSQLLGVAAPDLYISAGEASFELNFAKGYVGIWCQMVLVVGLGVMFSTFLSGAVAMVATLGCLVLGYFSDDIVKIFESLKTGNRKLVAGGGPVESFIRLITQKSITAPYDDSPTVEVMYWVDKVLMRFMTCWTDVLPDFSSYGNVHFVAYGFNIPGDLLLEQLTRMATFLFAAFLAGFLFLRMREVAR